MVSWTDSHAHLSDRAFAPDRDAAIARAQEAGVSDMVNICTDLETLQIGRELAQRHPCIHLAASTTPHEITSDDPFFEEVARAAQAGELVAIGETGLEYHYDLTPRPLQQLWLSRYLELAIQCDLPVVLHCREAFSDLFSLLDDYLSARGVFHCFTGTMDEAKGVIERGWYLSLSGIVTYKRSQALRDVAAWMPLEQLLIETDSPYLAPQNQRGKRNEPAFVREVGDVIAVTRGLPSAKIADITTTNARRLLKWKGNNDGTH